MPRPVKPPEGARELEDLLRNILLDHRMALRRMFESQETSLQGVLVSVLRTPLEPDSKGQCTTEALDPDCKGDASRVDISGSVWREDVETSLVNECCSEDAAAEDPARTPSKPAVRKEPHEKWAKSFTDLFKDEGGELMMEGKGQEDTSCLQRLVEGQSFRTATITLVFTNVLCIIAQLEIQGYNSAIGLNLKADSSFLDGASDFLAACEHAFNVMFMLELGLMLGAYGWQYLRSKANVFDAVIVIITCADAYVLQIVLRLQGGANMSFLRLAKLFKLAKIVRAFKAAVHFSELRVILNTIMSSMLSLAWSAALLTIIMLSMALFMAQMADSYINDTTADYDGRLWVYKHYGSALRSFYTVFEATLSGGWPNYVRPLVDHVTPWFAVYFSAYVFAVVFAVIRIITALFLRNTLKAASEDEATMIQDTLRAKKRCAEKLCRFFKEADVSADGMLDEDEFKDMADKPQIQEWLTLIGLEIHEIRGLFHVLENGSGRIPFEDFVGACLRLKGESRAIDQVILMHELKKVQKKLDTIDANFLVQHELVRTLAM